MSNYDSGDPDPPDSPEEAYLRAEPNILSPASPKPLHIPQPQNIPVLDNMMDIGFNQTEAHMSDASTRDTELRPGAWRDPNEPTDVNEQASPYSTGGEGNNGSAKIADVAPESESTQVGDAAYSGETMHNGQDGHSAANVSNGFSYAANSLTLAEHESAKDSPLAASYPSNSTAEAAQSATNPPAHSNEVDGNPSSSHASPVNFQSFLDSLQPSTSQATNVAQSTHATMTPPTRSLPPSSGADGASVTAGIPVSNSGLPPRPPPQEQPRINPNYVHSQNIRDYHPHATSPAVSIQASSNSTSNLADPQFGNFVPPVGGPSQYTSGSQSQQETQSADNARGHYNQQAHPNTTRDNYNNYSSPSGDTHDTENQRWSDDVERKYAHFLDEERKYVHQAKWEQFPPGSRLFVGNLSSEKVTKRDLYHVFHPYGELAQISIKQAYGFVQFLRVEDCERAMKEQEGRQIREKKIHLEPSNVQKNQRNQRAPARRSRSPDHRNSDYRNRYDESRQSNGRGRARDGGRDNKYRSPSPRNYRGVYDERYRTRSRSPDYGRDRYGDRRAPDDDLPLPHRDPRDVPDVQIIALDTLHRDFLSWVENAFTSRGVKAGVITISPRLSEDAVVRRQIVEGVLAVCKLRRANESTGKIGLAIFKRGSGNRDVQFEEYENLEPHIGAELMLREKQSLGIPPPNANLYGGYQGQYGHPTPAPAPPQQYGYPVQQPSAPPSFPPPMLPMGYPPGYGQPPGQAAAPAPPAPYAAQPGYPPPPQTPRSDTSNLQNLLSTLSTASPQGGSKQQHPIPNQNRYSQPPQYQGQQYPPQQALTQSPQTQGQQQGGSGMSSQGQQPSMQDILARLGTYNRR